jgi:hypothetical protein
MVIKLLHSGKQRGEAKDGRLRGDCTVIKKRTIQQSKKKDGEVSKEQ